MTKEKAILDLQSAGISYKEGFNHLVINHDGIEVTFWLKKQWFSGKGIRDGRGLDKLIKQLKEIEHTPPVCFDNQETYNALIVVFQKHLGELLPRELLPIIKSDLERKFTISYGKSK